MTEDGGTLRRGAVIRSSSLHRLTDAGWEAVQSYGVRTLIDLRTHEQAAAKRQSPPPEIETLVVPLEEDLDDDPEFVRWGETGLLGTPLYYGPFLRRWPDRCAAALAAVAAAPPGGVVIQCGRGRDRTGLIVTLLLRLVGVTANEIVADYLLSGEVERSEAARQLGIEDQSAQLRQVLDDHNTSVEASLLDFLETTDFTRSLRDSGLSSEDVALLRSRLRS